MRTLALAAVLSVFPAFTGQMTKGERQRLLAHFEMTETWISDEIAAMSKAQLEFHSAPDVWSPKDVLEHLAIAEAQYWQSLQDSLKAPASGYKAEAKDEGILFYGIDRTNRQKTGDARVPKGQYETADQALQAWKKLRQTMKNYVASTDDDLRGRQLKDGNMDLYQWLLMISTHSQRHILQVMEIKHNAKFPSK